MKAVFKGGPENLKEEIYKAFGLNKVRYVLFSDSFLFQNVIMLLALKFQGL